MRGPTVTDRSTPALLLCGYYGENNLGDDALLSVLVGDLPAGVQLWITAHDPTSVARIRSDATPVDRRSLRAVLAAVGRVDAVVFGGGSLLQDSTSFRSLIYYLVLIAAARLRGRSVLLWGQGLGPLHRPISRWLVRVLLPLCSSASWRDPSSFALARRWAPKVPMELGPDPVWSMPTQPWFGGGAIVLSWRPTPLLDHQGWRRLLDAVSSLADQLDARVCWMAFHQHQDAPLMAQLEQQGLLLGRLRERSTTVVPTELGMVFDLVKTARLVLPMRLHALVLARLAGCPMAALSYDPKVEAAAAMSGIAWSRLDQLPAAEVLLEQWLAAIEQGSTVLTTAELRVDAAVHGRLLRQSLAQR